MEKDTVSIRFVDAALARLAPAARLRVLDAAVLPVELLEAPLARVTADTFATVWLAVARELDDEFFGLDARRMKVGSFALLAQAAVSSGTLGRALRRILRGLRTFLDDIEGELRVAGGRAVIAVSNRIAEPAARRFADETFLVMVHGLACWLAGKRLAIVEAAFAQPRPAHAAEYAVMFSERLRFDAPQTALELDARVLDAPVVQDAAALRVFLRDAPQSVFLKYRNRDSWTARLRRRLRTSLGDAEWPALEDVAREFHVAAATLRRRLEAEGTSYQGIKDELRRDAAIHHLCHSPLPIADIGVLLGYREPSAFHRAFKKWSGVRPGEYRLRWRHSTRSLAKAGSPGG
jgi:AraC-like DNA-binding protein